jgi:hypothetical protein
MIRFYENSRVNRLRQKFKEMKPGESLRVGVSDSNCIFEAAGSSGVLLGGIQKTNERVTRDDNLEVPVYLVFFA